MRSYETFQNFKPVDNKARPVDEQSMLGGGSGQEHWTILGLSAVLFTISITVFKKTITKSLEVDRFTADGHLRPQAFWPYSTLPVRSACFESTRWVGLIVFQYRR
jgi:hypothetical protein